MHISILTPIFWTGFFLVFYAYFGYGILLFALVRLRRWFFPVRRHFPEDFHPGVAFIVCAYNEEEWIAQKIANSVALDYPREHIRFIFVTDGSDDRTAEIVRQYPFPKNVRWQLLHQPERRGKIAALQRAMQHVQMPVVVSSDANASVNCEAIKNIVRHFADPMVGAVAGEKRILMGEKSDAGGAGEGLYWQYESTLKKWDAELWSVVGAAGELFAFRSDLFESVPADTIVEDFYLSMRIAQKGYRVFYEPDAYAIETPSASVAEEMKRKVRIAAGGLQALTRLAPLLNVFRYGVLTFQYVSHRALRWTLAPLFLPVLLIINVILALQGYRFYQFVLLSQILFYAAALAGYVLEKRKMKMKAFFIPYYFCLMNYSMYAGFFRLLGGRQSVLWERAKRG